MLTRECPSRSGLTKGSQQIMSVKKVWLMSQVSKKLGNSSLPCSIRLELFSKFLHARSACNLRNGSAEKSLNVMQIQFAQDKQRDQ